MPSYVSYLHYFDRQDTHSLIVSGPALEKTVQKHMQTAASQLDSCPK